MRYDLAIVGGGLAGSSLALSLARHGARVIIVEHQAVLRDRIHGEVTHPWGVAEAVKLGIYQPLLRSCGHETRWMGTESCRDLIATTGCGFDVVALGPDAPSDEAARRRFFGLD